MSQSEKIHKKLPLSYRIQLISGLFALFSILKIFIFEAIGRSRNIWFFLLLLITIFICFVSGIIVQLKKGATLARFHGFISSLGVALSGIPVIFITIAICILFGPHLVFSIRYQKFDPQLWKQSEESVARAYIVDDLVESEKLIGLTKEEVIELLGEPSNRSLYACSPIPENASDSDIHYSLNPKGRYHANSGWLMISLDNSGKVNLCWLDINQ